MAGISGSILRWINGYLANSQPKVVLPSVESVCTTIWSGAPRGSIFNPLLFLLYNNDRVENIHYCIRCLKDNTSLYIIVDYQNKRQISWIEIFFKIHYWAEKRLVRCNPTILESIVLSLKIINPITRQF